MEDIRYLSTDKGGLSTSFWDNFTLVTSTFTSYPQKSATPITTIFIYKYLSPQANAHPHSANRPLYAKLSNLEGRYCQTNEMRASA